MRTLRWLFLSSILLVLLVATGPAQAASSKSQLRHVVAFKFKADASAAKVTEVVDAFRALKKKIPMIKGFEWGTNVSPEKLNKGFTHQFLLTFKSDKDRDAYLVHPAHQQFGKLVSTVLEDVMVIDFWSRD